MRHAYKFCLAVGMLLALVNSSALAEQRAERPVPAQAPQIVEPPSAKGLEVKLWTDKGDQTPTNLFDGDNSIFKNIVNILLFLVGAVSVIMLIFGGIKYVTSGGAPVRRSADPEYRRRLGLRGPSACASSSGPGAAHQNQASRPS